LRALINNAREKEIDKFLSLNQAAAKDRIESIINGPIYELNPEFWEEIRKPYMEEFKELSVSCEAVLQMGFHCSDLEVVEFLKSLESTLHQFTVDYIRKLFRDINTNLLRKFNKLFKKDETGKNREWRDIEEGKIRDLWAKNRAEMSAIINEFAYIRLSRGALLQALDESSKYGNALIIIESEITPGGEPSYMPPLLSRAFSRTRTSLSNQFDRLLTEEDLNRVKDKFQEDTDFVLEEAIRKHVCLTLHCNPIVAQRASNLYPMVDLPLDCFLRG